MIISHMLCERSSKEAVSWLSAISRCFHFSDPLRRVVSRDPCPTRWLSLFSSNFLLARPRSDSPSGTSLHPSYHVNDKLHQSDQCSDAIILPTKRRSPASRESGINEFKRQLCTQMIHGYLQATREPILMKPILRPSAGIAYTPGILDFWQEALRACRRGIVQWMMIGPGPLG